MPFLSVICPTMRVAGLDILFDSLAAQAFTDFELVLVDGLYDKREAIVREEAQNRFLCVRHVGLTPNPFPVCAFCAYANAGIVASTGQVLLFIVDYSRLPPDLLQKHVDFHLADSTKKRGLMAPHKYAELSRSTQFPVYERPEVDRYELDVKSGKLDRYLFTLTPEGDSITKSPAGDHLADGGAIVAADCDPKLRHPPGPIGPEFFHAKNESVRREHVLAIDGWDTELDGAHLYQDSDFADRLSTIAGVEWTLDPTAVLEIVNPRHIFPFARRLRDHQENFVIWQRKKVAGYPGTRNPLAKIPVVEKTKREQRADIVQIGGMRIAMVYGEFSRPGKPFDPSGLYVKDGLTGSESSFFNAAIGLSERGHEVVVFCKTEEPYTHVSGLNIMPLQALVKLKEIADVKATIAWNEPDYLKFASGHSLKIITQQLNDWAYCHEPNWSQIPDAYVFPSRETRRFHIDKAGLGTQYPMRDGADSWIVPNSCNLEHFAKPVTKHPRRAIWASSPDRGLHHLLALWPMVRARVPDAELRIFYRLEDLIDRVRHGSDAVARRARYMAAVLPKLKEYGVSVHGHVDNLRMAQEYQAATILPYTFDPTRHTETFGCTVLDACAGGCLPIVTPFDCLPEVHGNAALIIEGHPAETQQQWVETICAIFERGITDDAAKAMTDHASAHTRARVSGLWEQLLSQ